MLRRTTHWLLLWLGIGVGTIGAQAPPRASGPIHIIAVMVEFQPEENRFTSGNGTFQLDFLQRNPVTIDPLPHDRGYFEAHLEFAKRYFETVSDQALSITYEVLPIVYQLDHPMARYSPTGQSDSANYRLGWLARDTWEKVSESGALDSYTGDPDRTMFILFHAGVGRDLELTGTTLTKTPQDIPSVYLSQDSFARLLDDPGFTGFQVNSSGLRVTETAILPQTESRPGEDVTGAEFVIELSINGITTAMVGNFLGMPDLYNTETGASGIGRFGLMDGAGFFSYNGLFPPEPSAWEKTFMGWVTPQDIPLSDAAPISVPLGSVFRHRISADEHILVENRHRDPDDNGVDLTIRKPDGTIEIVTIPRDEERFSPFDLSEIDEILPAGTLIDVSHYDWSLPGGIDLERYLAGGILIWRIHEGVIRETIAENRINADPARRGVQLVEADAAQDIGRPAGLSASYDQGAPFDFWWSGNDFTVITLTGDRIVLYENRWGDDTTPNNRTTAGAPTYFEFYEFSDNLPNASFRARSISPDSYTANDPIPFPFSGSSDQSEAYALSYPLSIDIIGDHLLIPQQDRLVVVHRPTSMVGSHPIGSVHQPLRVGNDVFLTSHQSAGATSFDSRLVSLNNAALVPIWDKPAITGSIGYPVMNASGDVILIAGQSTGLTATDGTTVTVTHPNDLFTTDRRFVISEIGNTNWVILGDVLSREDVSIATDPFYWPHFGDRNADGVAETYYVNRSDGILIGRNSSGAVLDHFPIQPPNGFRFIGTPLLVDQTLIVYASDGYDLLVFGYGPDGVLASPYPLLVGRAPADDRIPIGMLFADQTLFAADAAGNLVSWTFDDVAPSVTARSFQPQFAVVGTPTGPDDLLVSSETYNWPNPASNETFVRFQSVAGATVRMDVIQYDGRPMVRHTVVSASGASQEIRLDTSNWGSGVYFCRIEARHDGKTAQKLFKIVVVK